jgi:ADP-heptose:LPS heptosyltransferase
MRLKSAERLLKRATNGAIAAMMGRGADGQRPEWKGRPYRVLFLRHDRIGDMILSTGILRAIAQSQTTVKLDVLASKTNAPVLKHETYLNEVIAFDKKATGQYAATFGELRRRRYDAVIDCMVTAPSTTTLLLMLASGARYRVGVAGRGNDFAYTLPVPPREDAEHIVDQLGALVAAFDLQPTTADLRPRVRLTSAEMEQGERAWRGGQDRSVVGKPRVLVNISAGRAHHYWPDDRFVHVIQSVLGEFRNAEVVVVSSPSDRERADAVAARGGARLVADEGIRHAMAIVAGANVVFTPDTSISHACSAFDKPVVVLHPRGFARLWGPYQTDGRALESTTDDVSGISADDAARALVTMTRATFS